MGIFRVSMGYEPKISQELEAKIGSLKRAILEKGAASIKELAKITGVTESYTYKLLRPAGICMMPKTWHNENRVLKIYEGGKKLEELADATDLSKSQVRSSLKRLKLPYRKKGRPKGNGKGTTRVSLRDELIARAVSGHQIAKLEGKKPQGIYEYMHLTNQHEAWKEKREELRKAQIEERDKKALISSVISSVTTSKLLSLEDPQAIQKVQEYRGSYPKSNLPLDGLYTFFSRYCEAQRKGEKHSIVELCDGTGLDPTTAGRVLSVVGLLPLYGTRERHALPKHKKEAIKRIALFPASALDIGYFLGVPKHSVDAHRGIKVRGQESRAFPRITGISLTYRLASQIYEAKDLGFSDLETAELLDIQQEHIDYVRKDKSLKTEIRTIIKTLYPRRKISKPYTTFNLK